MNVTKCDICKEEINEQTVRVGFGFWVDYMEVCEDCGAPVVEFLKKHKIIKEEHKKG